MVNFGRFIPSATTPIALNELYRGWTDSESGLEKFQNAVNSYLGVKCSYTFTSFMRAIYACLKSLKAVDTRCEVILPRFSCMTFAHAIIESGLRIKYCDVNPHTLSLDTESLLSMDFGDVLALIVVNHFGLSNPMTIIKDLCREKNIYLIEDLGYSFGTEFENSKLGSFGDFSVLNFKEGKAMPIGGGMVTTHHESIMEAPNRRTRASMNALLRLVGYKMIVNPYAYFLFKKTMKLLGYNAKRLFSTEDTIRHSTSEYEYAFNPNEPLVTISDFSGMVGLSILAKMDTYISTREKIALRLAKGISCHEDIELIRKEPGVTKIHYIRYPILIKNGKRDQLLSEFLRRGIEASAVYPEIKENVKEFPGSKKVSRELLTLPCHPGVTERDVEVIVETIRTTM